MLIPNVPDRLMQGCALCPYRTNTCTGLVTFTRLTYPPAAGWRPRAAQCPIPSVRAEMWTCRDPRLILTHAPLSPQEEAESRAMLFRDFGDPMASFAAQLEANTANLVRQA